MDKRKKEVKQEQYVPKSYLACFVNDSQIINVYDYKKMKYKRK